MNVNKLYDNKNNIILINNSNEYKVETALRQERRDNPKWKTTNLRWIQRHLPDLP